MRKHAARTNPTRIWLTLTETLTKRPECTARRVSSDLLRARLWEIDGVAYMIVMQVAVRSGAAMWRGWVQVCRAMMSEVGVK